ncbi:hypothetical protein [Mesorhizobium argentiipisi]|uniref:Uncharacterized protein n=1 Tax=Mesorhizobium argentiipisi TaxID=3015175 RepID=A0ABU8KJW5_9HYPH
MKAEEGKHCQHDDDQTNEIDDTVHGAASSMHSELPACGNVPLYEQLFSNSSFALGLCSESGKVLPAGKMIEVHSPHPQAPRIRPTRCSLSQPGKA